MEIGALAGTTYGPTTLHVSEQSVADFAEVTGSAAADGEAPPGFAAAALFTVAPPLLESLSGMGLVHGDQSFRWHRPMATGMALSVAGEVTRSRERRGVHFLDFELAARDEGELVLEASSTFLVSPAPGQVKEAEEPAWDNRGEPEPGELSASRLDLIRYAAATRDWNPVHWDHHAAAAAGFPGVVVHGLLQAAWMIETRRSGPGQLDGARFRFRNPLRPATPVRVEERDGWATAVLTDGETEYVRAGFAEAGNG